MKKCPFCSEEILDDAIKCKHCSADLTTKDALSRAKVIKSKQVKEENARIEKEKILISWMPGMPEKLKWFGAKFSLDQLNKINSLGPDEAKKYLLELKAKNESTIIWILAVAVIIGLWIAWFQITGLSIVLIATWLFPKPGESIFINRLRNIWAYKTRAYISIVLVLFSSIDIYAISRNILDPIPEIRITSNTSIISGTKYELTLTANSADNVKVNGNNMEKISDWSFKSTVEMPTSSVELNIVASNFSKSANQNITISRPKTIQEIEQDRLAEKARVDRLAAESKAEAERLVAEKKAADKIAADKILWDRTKAGKICKQNPGWTKDDCNNIAQGRFWIGMSYKMLETSWWPPNSRNPSNYGNGTQWQWCWRNVTPSCFYDNNWDGLIDSYN